MILAILANACGRQNAADFFDVAVYSPSEAEGFEIAGAEGCESTVIRVKTAWQDSGNDCRESGISERGSSPVNELFIARNGERPPAGFKGQVLDGDAKRIAAMSSTHIALLDLLGETSRVKAVSGMRFISNKYILEHQDSIADIGSEADADFEALAAASPDIVLLYGISSASTMEDRLEVLGIPCLYIGEYLEASPLGRTEWVVAIAELLGCREKGEKAYQRIASKYEEIKSSVPDKKPKPKVMLNTPYGDTWFMASPRSAMAAMIRDAGGEYIFETYLRRNMSSEGSDSGPESSTRRSWKSTAIDYETAFLLVSEADVWLNAGQYQSLEQLASSCPQLADTECVKNRKVYSCDRRSTEGGGSDFWESGTVRPDLVLGDLIRIFHPELCGQDYACLSENKDGGCDSGLYYYRSIE